MPSTLATLLGIVLGTFVSEDLALIGAGVLVREGHVDAWLAVAACATGIFVGDVGLWVAGRLGAPALGRLRDARLVDTLVAWLDASPALAILCSRFLPGARLPMYVAAGAWGRRPRAVFGWMLVAAAVWSPLVVGAVVLVGSGVATTLETSPHAASAARLTMGAAAGALLVVFHRTRLRDWSTLDTRLQRATRWEFWPAWLVNAPVVAAVVALGIRHRSLTLFTAANPGIADGGLVGESKAAILEMLPPEWTLPWVVIEPGPLAIRMAVVHARRAERELRWPLVAKPDVSQRGVAVRWIDSDDAAADYLARVPGRVVLQAAHDGPFEAGVYYERAPGAVRGRVTSITDKRFPFVTGDGSADLEHLILAHPRLRLQAPLFLRRHRAALTSVPAAGTIVPLGRVGNHAQGTEFRDGQALWTDALERRVDAIARQVPGFHLGRFDIRYADRDAFMAGEDLAIVELNGVAAEPTHIYDPDASLVAAWRALLRHWSMAFRFGALNRAHGHRPSSLRRLMVVILEYLRAVPVDVVSD